VPDRHHFHDLAKVNFKTEEDFQTSKNGHQRTTIYQPLTTTSPQKHHRKTPFFRENPLKNGPPTTPKKNAARQPPDRIPQIKPPYIIA
jgi:hypothetical protein